LINYSEVDDLAVIKIEASGLPVLPIGTSGDVLVGDDVVIIGHPAGLEFGWSTTGGIISAINREVKIKNPDGTLNKKMTLLQTNANVNSGNSGGPMMNLKGEVIGIITMKLSDGYEGMGFAIPIDGAMEILDAIIERGSADGVDSSVSKSRAVLGVTGFDVVEGFYYYIEGDRIRILSENELDQYEGEFYVNVSGFYLSGISEKSKCYGILQPGDIIFAIDGTATDSRTKMMAILDEKNVGDEAVIEYDRNGEVFSVKITMIAEE
jgi:serine protease Do